MPDRAESFGEVDSSENRPRAQPRFVNPIQNGLRKERNLIQSRPSRAETGLAERENRIRLGKKSRHHRTMRSKHFKTQEVREIG